jgi:hypothetical protein
MNMLFPRMTPYTTRISTTSLTGRGELGQCSALVHLRYIYNYMYFIHGCAEQLFSFPGASRCWRLLLLLWDGRSSADRPRALLTSVTILSALMVHPLQPRGLRTGLQADSRIALAVAGYPPVPPFSQNCPPLHRLALPSTRKGLL